MAGNASHDLGDHVAVIGTGPLGLVAMKNLKEQGLRVTAIERNDFIGGLWHVDGRKGQTTALPMTTFNTSKQASHFTDFPFPKDTPTHPPAKNVEQYLQSYAEEFDLLHHVQLSRTVTRVERDDAADKWVIYTKDTNSSAEDESEKGQTFDRVVFATGILKRPVHVNIKGVENFAGDVMHSQDFKEPHLYEDKNVVVIGIGATGADTQSFLKRAKARSVYLSHRSQFYLLPRMFQGKAFDHGMSRRGLTIIRSLGNWWPRGCAALFKKALVSARRKAWPWLDKHPSFKSPRAMDGVEHRIPLFSEDLAENLRDGITKAVPGVHAVTGPKSVKLTDGTVLEDIDAIIICSGYHHDFSLIKGPGNPIDPSKAPDHFERINAAKHKQPDDHFPRLYRGFISEQYPDSLAFLGHFLIMKAPFVVYDLATMALASIWSGSAPTATPEEMRRDIDAHYDTIVETLGRGPVPHMGARMFGSATYEWLNKVAGTGVIDRVGCFSREAWKLWWNDRKFYNLLMDGVDTPPVYRLFDTGRGRKAWPGAREQIVKSNEEVQQMTEKWKEDNNKKTK